MSPLVLVLNGPNLNLLGVREPEVYGLQTLDDIQRQMTEKATALGLAVDFRQSNHEGVLIDWIHQARETAVAIIINPGAFGHSSIALLDALSAVTMPVIEVHLSNVFRRESFRHHSFVSLAATGVICGLGSQGYLLALDAVASRLANG